MRVVIIIFLLFSLTPAHAQSIPSLTRILWTAPGTLLVSFSGGCLFYTRPGYPTAYIACDSPAELRQTGDAAYWPFADGVLSVQNGLGNTAESVIPAQPLWYELWMPIMAMGP